MSHERKHLVQIDPDADIRLIKLYTIGEVAELFGMNVQSVNKRVREGKLESAPSPGRSYRFDKNYIDELYKELNAI